MGLLRSCEAIDGITSLKKVLSKLNKNNDKMFKNIFLGVIVTLETSVCCISDLWLSYLFL